MEGFKGTPGPWFVHDTYEDYNDDSGIIVWNGDDQAHKPICDMGDMGDMNYAEDLANAQLIASAPDMLAALQEIASLANFCGDDLMKLRMIRNEADTIIAKALGSKSIWKGEDHG